MINSSHIMLLDLSDDFSKIREELLEINSLNDFRNWPTWVSEEQKNEIIRFWSHFNRKPIDWLTDMVIQGAPYFSEEMTLNKLNETFSVSGKYIHKWNTLGLVIDKDSKEHEVTFVKSNYWNRHINKSKVKSLRRRLNNETLTELVGKHTVETLLNEYNDIDEDKLENFIKKIEDVTPIG